VADALSRLREAMTCNGQLSTLVDELKGDVKLLREDLEKARAHATDLNLQRGSASNEAKQLSVKLAEMTWARDEQTKTLEGLRVSICEANTSRDDALLEKEQIEKLVAQLDRQLKKLQARPDAVLLRAKVLDFAERLRRAELHNEAAGCIMVAEHLE
jgi:uncharacterized coiled-coil DUF342 family protein